MIKNLVISSGAHNIFTQFSAIKTLLEKKFIELKNIKKIYGTSSGAIIGLLLSLNLEIIDIYNYLLNRPWGKLYSFDTTQIFNSYENNGVFDITIFKKSFYPLIKLTTLKENFTFKDLYEYSGKKLHVFATECNNIKTVDFSMDNTPELSVIKAIYMSCCIPILFKPIKYENKFYIDGAFTSHFPINEFIKNNPECNRDEILGINIFMGFQKEIFDDNLINFNFSVLNNFWKKVTKYDEIKYIMKLSCNYNFILNEFYKILEDKTKRLEYFECGKKEAEIFIKSFE
jgi:predicted acylesterase/phospholipase RssA